MACTDDDSVVLSHAVILAESSLLVTSLLGAAHRTVHSPEKRNSS